MLPSADTAAMLFWALLASGQINACRKVDGWQTLRHKAHRSANRPRRVIGIDDENGEYRHSGLPRRNAPAGFLLARFYDPRMI